MTHTRVIFKLNYWFVFIGCFEVIYHVRNLLERKKNCPPLQQQQQHWTRFWLEKSLTLIGQNNVIHHLHSVFHYNTRMNSKGFIFDISKFSFKTIFILHCCNINMWQGIFFCIRIYVLSLWFERHLPFSYNEGAPARFLSLVLSSFGRNPLFQLLGTRFTKLCFQHHSN